MLLWIVPVAQKFSVNVAADAKRVVGPCRPVHLPECAKLNTIIRDTFLNQT